MILKELKKKFHNQLSDLFPKTEIDSFFYFLLEEYTGLKRIDLTLQPNYNISNKNINAFSQALDRLKKEEPIQYIIGKTEFYGFPFIVNKHTLIPRPETEELVSWILNTIQTSNKKPIQILDIGTGSGCISIALKKNNPDVSIYALDISSEALEVAKQNAERNNVSIHFIHKDILTTSDLNQSFDIIISNPPYVRELEKKEMKNNVLKYEPELALFVPNKNPLIFYQKIAQLASKSLTENGILFFEINEYLFSETEKLLLDIGFHSIEIKKDIFGKNRFIKALR